MGSMIELPVGSLVGLCVFCGVVGIVLGRSGRFMARLGQMHAKAHSRSDAKAEATAHQNVQTFVVVGSDGQRRAVPVVDRSEVVGIEGHRTAEIVEGWPVDQLVPGETDEYAWPVEDAEITSAVER